MPSVRTGEAKQTSGTGSKMQEIQDDADQKVQNSMIYALP